MKTSSLLWRDNFITWQCRLRRAAMRENGGRPSPGMCPRVTHEDGSQISLALTMLIVEKQPAASADLFRHTVRKTHDPRHRYEEGLRLLSSEYYQHPKNFSDVMTALFSVDSRVASTLVKERRCVLDFRQGSQHHHFPCSVSELTEDDPAYQVTCWHNRLFNPTPPHKVRVLAFSPDWSRAKNVIGDR